MTAVILNPSSNDHTLADALLKPLQWCGQRWNCLCMERDGGCLTKIFQAAWRIITGALLAVLTAAAFVPGIAGSLIKSFSENSHSYKLHLTMPMDPQLKARCRQIGFHDSKVKDADLAKEMIRILPSQLFTCVGVQRIAAMPPSRVVTLQPSGSDFYKHLANCFLPSEVMSEATVKGLPDFLLNSGSASDKERDQILKLIASSSKIYLWTSENFKEDLRISLV